MNPIYLHAGAIAVIVLQCLAVFLIPVGLPGIWVQVLAATVFAIVTGQIGWGWIAGFFVLAVLTEISDLLMGQWGARRFGGSSKAGWGALLGGIAGAIIGGIPVPVIGAVIASFLGTFFGALIGEMLHQRQVAPNLRVGVGALIGRLIATTIKLSAAFAIIIATVVLLFLSR